MLLLNYNNKLIKTNWYNHVRLWNLYRQQSTAALPDNNKSTIVKTDMIINNNNHNININKSIEISNNSITHKLNNIFKIYEEVSGMNEVRAAQDRVIIIQDQLKIAQERRRHILFELSLLQNQLKDLHFEIQNCVRGEHRYVELVKHEFNLLQKEKEKADLFKMADTEERDLFTHLTATVKYSHDKERTQANNVKYWSIIGSLCGALLGIMATTLSFYSRNSQFETTKNSLNEHSNLIRSLIVKIGDTDKKQKDNESWGSYLKRHTVNVYRYIVPGSRDSKNSVK